MIWSSWLISAAVLLILEIVSPGTFFFACLSIGAAFAALSSLMTANLWVQVIVFTVTAIVSMYFIRPFARKFFSRSQIRSNVDSLIGKKAVVVEPIEPLKPGRVKIGGEFWLAESDIAVSVGSQVEISAVDGTKLIVKSI